MHCTVTSHSPRQERQHTRCSIEARLHLTWHLASTEHCRRRMWRAARDNAKLVVLLSRVSVWKRCSLWVRSVCDTGAGSDKLTFTSKTGLSAFLLDGPKIDSTVWKRRDHTAPVMCSTATPRGAALRQEQHACQVPVHVCETQHLRQRNYKLLKFVSRFRSERILVEARNRVLVNIS